MGIRREEIMPGVWLNCIRSDKFKSALLSINLLAQLDKDTAAMNALIPAVLSRGTALYPDLEKLSNRMDELYGVDVVPVVRLVGEIQCFGFVTSFPEAEYLPVGPSYTTDVIELTAEMLLNPLTRGGLLLKDYVESEKNKLAENIRSIINDKNSYACRRCIEEMCRFEALSVGQFGSAEDCDGISYKKLSKHYRNVLMSSPVEIIYVGSSSPESIAASLKDALVTMPRGEIDYDIGTDVRMNTVEETARYYEEHLEITQGKLVLGFRLGDWMENPDAAVLSVFNAIYGSGVTSKLFTNVREKLHLCYYASSSVNISKGTMLVASGIDFENYDAAKEEILFQLNEIRQGHFSDEELGWAKAAIRSDLKGIPDSPASLESYWFRKLINGTDISPEEYAEAVEEVTAEEVIELAGSIALDLLYFLRNDPDEVTEMEETES